MTPEQKARQLIDDQLQQTGWAVQSADEMDISAARGVAVREFPLESGFADYLLYADCKALGTIEAKPEGYPLTSVEPQSRKYSTGLPAGLPNYRLPLPFAYESTGSVTQFTNFLDPDPRAREVFTFHRPEELIRLAMLDRQLRANLRNMPELITAGLWNVQVEAIRNLEIVVDECHRSIYNVWRQVLEYFDAFIIGLTATPTPQTIGFFSGNLVQDYSHEKAVIDGVNVGYDVYRIETKITASGARLAKEPGVFVPHRDRRTRKKLLKELESDLTYTASDLDRDVVAMDQIRLVIRTFKERLFTEIFPGRSEVPKTLVFAKTDLHADDIVKVIREEFDRGNEFCQKITSKTTGKKPDDLLNEFRNSYNPRIAVTVDMIATGTDVKPLECLIFMRNINSASYFEQMKGRGCRVIQSDDLQGVTPDARQKTHFVIVDAVGVCERDKTLSKPLDRKPSVSLEKLLNTVAAGAASDEICSTLAARLARLDRQIDQQQRSAILKSAGCNEVSELAGRLLDAIDPDANARRAAVQLTVPAEVEPTEQQMDRVEQTAMQAALRPFYNPKLREAIIAAKAAAEQVIDEVTKDELVTAGKSPAAKLKAQTILANFRQFIEDNKDEIEALQILYSRPYRSGLRYRHVKELAEALKRPPLAAPLDRLWRAYQLVEPEKVRGDGGKQLIDVVALVRHALDPNSTLVPVGMTVEERYREWLGRQAASGLQYTAEQRKWLDAIKDHIASSLRIEQDDFDDVPFNGFGGLGKAYELFGEQLGQILEAMNEGLAA
jgi:type I restriction enzyme, R subunit